MNPDGTVKTEQKISSTAGGFEGELSNGDLFHVVASLDDLDGDGIVDLAVGAPGDDDGAADSGAVWVLFLNSDGSVKSQQKISQTEGGFSGVLDVNVKLGRGLGCVGDLDGDGVSELVAGAIDDADGGIAFGAIWVLFMNVDGTVKHEQKVSALAGGFQGELGFSDTFGQSIAGLSDLDGDGVIDIAVGAKGDDDGAPSAGAIWVLFMNPDGTVRTERKISATSGDFQGPIDAGDTLAYGLVRLGDLDGDGVIEIAAGAIGDDDGGVNVGAVWIISIPGCADRVDPCLGDIDADGDIDGADLGLLLAQWDDSGSAQYDMREDVDGNGIVNGGDLGILLAAWGRCPFPA